MHLSPLPPSWVPAEDATEDLILEKTRMSLAANGRDMGKDEYFTTSKQRYRQYLRVLKTLPTSTSVLEVGSAPGHMSISMHHMGFSLQCVNLNEHYRPYYPDPKWLDLLNVKEHNFEESPLPYPSRSFDAIVFTEVLEHIAIKHPRFVLEDLHRLLRDDGLLLLSTPNVCNISNIYALLHGANVFWQPDQFYGSLDRHNREYAPEEVRELLEGAGFRNICIWGMICDSNWHGLDSFPYDVLATFGTDHALLLNTIMATASR